MIDPKVVACVFFLTVATVQPYVPTPKMSPVEIKHVQHQPAAQVQIEGPDGRALVSEVKNLYPDERTSELRAAGVLAADLYHRDPQKAKLLAEQIKRAAKAAVKWYHEDHARKSGPPIEVDGRKLTPLEFELYQQVRSTIDEVKGEQNGRGNGGVTGFFSSLVDFAGGVADAHGLTHSKDMTRVVKGGRSTDVIWRLTSPFRWVWNAWFYSAHMNQAQTINYLSIGMVEAKHETPMGLALKPSIEAVGIDLKRQLIDQPAVESALTEHQSPSSDRDSQFQINRDALKAKMDQLVERLRQRHARVSPDDPSGTSRSAKDLSSLGSWFLLMQHDDHAAFSWWLSAWAKQLDHMLLDPVEKDLLRLVSDWFSLYTHLHQMPQQPHDAPAIDSELMNGLSELRRQVDVLGDETRKKIDGHYRRLSRLMDEIKEEQAAAEKDFKQSGEAITRLENKMKKLAAELERRLKGKPPADMPRATDQAESGTGARGGT